MCDNLHLLRIVVVKCFDLERLRELLGRWCVKFEDIDCGWWCDVVEY